MSAEALPLWALALAAVALAAPLSWGYGWLASGALSAVTRHMPGGRKRHALALGYRLFAFILALCVGGVAMEFAMPGDYGAVRLIGTMAIAGAVAFALLELLPGARTLSVDLRKAQAEAANRGA